MKTIRQTLILLTFALFFAANVTAAPLDERQRTVETVVADALAQLPAATAGDYDKIMGELAATGAEGVGILADMLVPASQGENAAVEYALNGVASFVTAAGREQLRPAVCEGLLAALARCKDDANRAFLVSQLQLCATADNAAALAAYIDDPYLGDPVLRALISIPDSEATLLSLARRSDLSDAQRAALAYAFGEKRTAAAEPILLGWIDGADDATRAALYPALASCGTAASAKALEAAARAVDYGCDETAATDSYLRLLDRMVDEGAARDAVKAAKRLLKCERANVRGAALEVIVRAEGTRAMPYVLAALEKGDIQYRNAALRYIGDKADDAVYATIAADRKRLSDEAWADVIEWFGVRHAASQTGAVTEAVGSSNDAVALAGIRAAGRLGGDEALAWYAAVSDPVARLSELPGCYARAHTILSYRHLLPEQHVLTADVLKKPQRGGLSELDEVDASKADPAIIRSFLQTGMREEIPDFVSEYLSSFGNALNSLLFRQYVLLELRFSAIRAAKSFGYSQEEFLRPLEPAQARAVDADLPELKKSCAAFLRRAIELREEESGNQYKSMLKRALHYIDQNYTDENLSLNAVAKAANISPNYFSGVFSQEMGQTFVEYLTEKRMARAKELLRYSGKRSSEVAYEVGYRDPRYFSFLFKKTQGCTPSSYRAGNGDGHEAK